MVLKWIWSLSVCNTWTVCQFHGSNGNGFGDIWWTDNPIYFSSTSFRRSIHLSLGLPLGRDPSMWVFSTDFATLSSSLRCTWPRIMRVISSWGKYWLALCVPFPNEIISDVIFSCFGLYPSQHLHFCCVHLVLLTFRIAQHSNGMSMRV